MAADDAAVVVTLRANLKDYEAALKSAVRSTETAARAAEKAVSGIGKGGGASKVIEGNFKKSSQAIANDAKILQFQLNDIFSGLASGQGIRAVQVQLGQIAQQMTGSSLIGGARLLGTALAGMVNPLNLAIVAFGVLAGVAASYFTSSEEQAKAATDALKKQADELDNLAKKYGKLFPEIQRAADRQRALLDAAEKAVAVQTALSAAYEDTGKTLDTLGDQLLEIQSLLDFGDAPNALNAITKSFDDLKTAVKNHNASSKDAQELLKTLNNIIASTEGRVKELATAMRDELVASFGELDRAAKSAGETIQNALNFQMPGAGGPLDLAPLLRARQGATLSGSAADFIRREEQFIPTAKWDVNAFRTGFGSDTYVDKMGEVQKVTKDTVVTLQQANQDLARRIPEFQKTITDAIGADLWQSLTDEQQAALTSIAYNFGSLPKSIVAALKAGDRGQVAAAIAGLSGNAGRRGREAAPFGGAPAAVAVKETTAATKETTAATKEATEAWRAFNEELQRGNAEALAVQQQVAGLLSSALTGFAHDLESGKDAGEAFSNMLKNVASQIIDMAIQMAIVKPLMNSLFGGLNLGGTPAGLFEAGGTVGMSGRHDGRKFSPALWAGAPRFASGGMVGLRPGEMPIIAHRGEIILPNARRMAGSAAPASGRQTVKVEVSAAPSPLLDLSIKTSARAAEERAVSRGPAVARANNQRYATP